MKVRSLAAAAAMAVMTAAAPASAVVFNLHDTGGAGTGTAARFGFDVAAGYWSSVLKDNITVNLDIGFRSLGPGILGSTSSNTGSLLVQNLYGGLFFDQTSALDAQAVGSLKDLSPSAFGGGILALDAITSGYVDPVNRVGIDTDVRVLDNDGSANNVVFDTNTATMKALGFTEDDDGNSLANVTDGSIVFSSDFGFDFHPEDGIFPSTYDFIAVAIHEIGHALGFVSGVDIYDLLGRPNSPPYDPSDPDSPTYADYFEAGAFGSADIGEFRVMSPLDLYRYSSDGLDWSVGTNSYFSINGGASQLFGNSLFSTGQFNGDGSQASHWKDNTYAPRTNPRCSNPTSTPIGIMNPTIGACEGGVVTALDLAAMDAIGWDVDFDVLANSNYSVRTQDIVRAFIPEPSTWAMLILGFATVGGALRRRRSLALAA